MKPLMQQHRDPLDLRSLPLVEPPADGWPAVEAALRGDRRRRRLRNYTFGGLAAAAALALALGLSVQLPRPAGQAPTQTAAAGAPVTPPGSAAGQHASGQSQTLASMIRLSQQLEHRLRTIRLETGDLPATAVVHQVELEDLIVQVDEELSLQPESLALWSQRVNLLLDLESLYANSLRREYHRIASL